MRIYFDYPLATEENMHAVQEAIDAGKETCDLVELFDENVLWDCIAVLSGNKDTPWALLDHMNGHEQIGMEDWQSEVVDDYIDNNQLVQSLHDDGLALQIGDKILLIELNSDAGWDYYLVNNNVEELYEGGIYGDANTTIDEAIREIMGNNMIPMNRSITKLHNFNELWDRALDV